MKIYKIYKHDYLLEKIHEDLHDLIKNAFSVPSDRPIFN